MNINTDLPRIALFAVIGGLVLLLLNKWVGFSAEYDAALKAQQELLAAPEIEYPEFEGNMGADTGTDSSLDDLPLPTNESSASAADVPEDTSTPAVAKNSSTNTSRYSRTIEVETDTLRVTIDKQGGDIVGVSLLKYRQSLDNGAEPFVLLEKNSNRTYIAQSGLVGPNGTDTKGRAVFQSASTHYSMENNEVLDVDLTYRDPAGTRVIKRFSFQPGEHLVNVTYLIDNQSTEQWRATFYSQIKRDSSEDPGANDVGFGIQAYLGAATTTEDSPYEKISFADMADKNFSNKRVGGWVAMLQHYFVSAWVPDAETTHSYFTRRLDNNDWNIIGFTSAPLIIEPGDNATVGAQFYAGPKDQYRLEEIAPHLDLTVDYGWLWWIAQPLYALLYFFATGELHAFGKVLSIGGGVGNWGIAIILLTVVIKLAFFRLSAASYRSMANMRRVQPKLMALRERHGDDKQAQSKAMMELYQKEKINPLGGCLPILIQMPVFIALYWALIESVELRHAPFFLWIDDLSVMDPYFVLPIIMGATMWFQQKLNPPPPDPMQAKVMQWMPIIFTFFFLWFPSGLVIYWVSNNVLSIAQQWAITRQIENADKAKA